MEPVDLLCSRNARPQKDGGRAARPFLLAERARWNCARPMRAVKGSPATPLGEKVWLRREENRKPSPGIMARLGVALGGRVRKCAEEGTQPHQLRSE